MSPESGASIPGPLPDDFEGSGPSAVPYKDILTGKTIANGDVVDLPENEDPADDEVAAVAGEEETVPKRRRRYHPAEQFRALLPQYAPLVAKISQNDLTAHREFVLHAIADFRPEERPLVTSILLDRYLVEGGLSEGERDFIKGMPRKLADWLYSDLVQGGTGTEIDGLDE